MLRSKFHRCLQLFFLIPVLAIQACLPGSPSEPKDLFPTDSLSRATAQAIPHQELNTLWEKTHESEAYGHLSTVRITETGVIAADLQLGRLWEYDLEGNQEESSLAEGLTYPYLLEAVDAEVTIFNAGTQSIDQYRNGSKVNTITLPDVSEGKSLMYFPSLHKGKIYLKTQPDKGLSKFYELNGQSGQIENEQTLPGPSWLHKGFLRSNGNDLLSLSGFYPAFYRMNQWPKVDSLRLQGFDSPMLARMRQKAIGEEDLAPLIISSAVLFDSLLFVNNVRPGWSRVDVYNYDGHLIDILEEPIPPNPTEYNTLDIDVAKDGDDYLIALVAVKTHYKTLTLEYHSKLSLYRWKR